MLKYTPLTSTEGDAYLDAPFYTIGSVNKSGSQWGEPGCIKMRKGYQKDRVRTRWTWSDINVGQITGPMYVYMRCAQSSQDSCPKHRGTDIAAEEAAPIAGRGGSRELCMTTWDALSYQNPHFI